MIYSLLDRALNPQFLVALFAAVATIATIITLAMPYLSSDKLNSRMKYVSKERYKIRDRERARLAQNQGRVQLRRQTPKAFMADIVDRLNLRKALESEDTRDKLAMAGLRGQPPLIGFLFARIALPIICFLATLFYIFVFGKFENQPATIKLLAAVGGAYFGFYLPNLYISNRVSKRQTDISRAFPDALDLLLICVESGMSVEAAFKKVSQEIGSQSIALAEELTLTTAELSYLQERRQAYENLGRRTGLPGVKAVVTALIQAERYGTPLGTALRVMAQENRDMRMAEAERKAAGLPPKLTVPMIAFFLPVLFVVILGPAAIRLMAVTN
ncbi:MAG: type II secretion system F family protein [Flavobacteriaceae bacterium]